MVGIFIFGFHAFIQNGGYRLSEFKNGVRSDRCFGMVHL